LSNRYFRDGEVFKIIHPTNRDAPYQPRISDFFIFLGEKRLFLLDPAIFLFGNRSRSIFNP
jgi:hypothetical protein